MGYFYHELVPPAILLDHPGITKEQYAGLLEECQCTTGVVSRSEPWESSQHSFLETEKGLKGLATVLNLGYSKAFERFQETPRLDHKGNRLRLPEMYFNPGPNYELGDHNDLRYAVDVHKGYIVGQAKTGQTYTRDRLKIGETIDLYDLSSTDRKENDGEFYEGVVTKIVEEVTIAEDSNERKINPDEEIDFDFECFKYVLEVLPFRRDIQTNEYQTADQFHQAWPMFKPENMYDFTQPKGYFYVPLSYERYRWLNKNGKYYLDPKTFDLIGVGLTEDHEFGYTDLILTAEAVRNKAWKLLSRYGLVHVSDFLRDFPQSKERYERAVIDAYSSLNAKRRGLSNIQFLRMRIDTHAPSATLQ